MSESTPVDLELGLDAPSNDPANAALLPSSLIGVDESGPESAVPPIESSPLASGSGSGSTVTPNKDPTAQVTNQPVSRQQPPANVASQWIAITLQPWAVLSFVVLCACIAAAILYLLTISDRSTGFVTVPSNETTLYGQSVSLNPLWTSLPSFALTITAIWFTATAGAFAFRQPFVELARSNGGNASVTIQLDYRVNLPFSRWYVALKNKHIAVGLSQLLVFVLGVLSPAGSSLFVARWVTLRQDVRVGRNSTFDQDRIGLSLDERAVLDAAAARLVYGAGPLPWTLGEKAVRPFFPTSPLSSEASALRADTTAHYARARCEVLYPTTFSTAISQNFHDLTSVTPGDGACHQMLTYSSSTNASALASFRCLDRGCAISVQQSIESQASVYLATKPEQSCSTDAGRSRLVFAYIKAAAVDGTVQPSNVSVVSCAVAYMREEGSGVVAVPQSWRRNSEPAFEAASGDVSPGLMHSFTITGDSRDSLLDPLPNRSFWFLWERKLFEPTSFSPTQLWQTTHVGAVVLYRALRLQGFATSELTSVDRTIAGGGAAKVSADELAKAAEDVFVAAYATAMATTALAPLADGRVEEGMGTVETQMTRLLVVRWAAGFVVAFLLSMAGLALWMLEYTGSNGTLLFEEPTGLLGYAALLEDSDLMDHVTKVKALPRYNGEFIKALEGTKDGWFTKSWKWTKRHIGFRKVAETQTILDENVSRKILRAEWRMGDGHPGGGGPCGKREKLMSPKPQLVSVT